MAIPEISLIHKVFVQTSQGYLRELFTMVGSREFLPTYRGEVCLALVDSGL